MSSVGVSSGKRASVHAAAAAAKQRRQKIIAAVLGVVLIAVLAYEGPTLLKLGGGPGGASSDRPVVPSPVQNAAPSRSADQLKALRQAPARDLFAQPLPGNGDPIVRAIGPPAGSIDPFGGSTAGSSPSQAPSAPVVTSPLPQTIVIGKPGGNRKATHGWIVILASIPTAQGRGSANSFAKKAKSRGLNPVSVLNSSNRRPLRGGYWVVYTGPFATLGAVTSRAGTVHSVGYPTAYIRELLVYR